MGKRYLIISDLHLADVEDHADGWKAHKASRYVFDEQLDELVASLEAQARAGEDLILVLNGDIFDFDIVTAIPDPAPFPVSARERGRGVLQPTEEKSVWKLGLILKHHPRFVATLARFLAAGHRVVYVLGNHDRELHFPAAQAAFIAAIAARAPEAGRALVAAGVQFEEWFYWVPGEIYVEHGNQYDHYSSYRHILAPVVRSQGEDEIAVPMGNLTNRYLASGMGFFNPHSGDFILGLFGYLAHWLKYYAFTRRSLIGRWFVGSLLVLAKLLETKGKAHRQSESHAAALAERAARLGVPLATLQALDRLQRPPMATKLFRVIHEFWIDRLGVAAGMVALTIVLALTGVPLWAKLMVPLSAFPLLYFIYDWAVRGDTLYTVEKEVPRYAEAIASRLGVKVVSFGHTHIPQLVPLARGVVFVNSGTWAPIMRKTDDRRLAPGYRNFVVCAFDGRDVAVTLDSWLPGEQVEREPDVVPLGAPGARRPDAAPAFAAQRAAQ
ncbi:MAG TPA: metallophosphoesterase [Polyangia bacterium]|jgi:hypothetical protein